MPFALVDGEVQVEASVNGERGRVVLDTGVHHNLVAPRIHHPLQGVLRQGGEFEQLWVGAAYKDVDRFHGVPVEVFGSTFELRDVAFMAPGAGDALARIGVGLLERQLIQFDFPHRRVRFITRDLRDGHLHLALPAGEARKPKADGG